MLHFGEQNLVTPFQLLHAPGISDKIDAFSGPARENDFVAAPSVDELGGAISSRFKARGCAITQFVDATMNVRVVALVILRKGVNDRSRLLRSCRIIKVNQG